MATGTYGRGRGRGGDRPFCTHCQRRGHVLDTCYQLHGRPSTNPITNNRPICAHCKAPGHTRDRCFELHDQPSIPRSANVTTSGVGPTSINECIPASAPSVHSAQSAGYLSTSSSQWIIDTGASDHMTSSVDMMQDYSPTSSYSDVCIADGTHLPVKGTGTVPLTRTLTLQIL